jgi:hypothetical protein
MALLFLDSFDHYQTADFDKKWTSGAGIITAGEGRCGTAALDVDSARGLDRGMVFTGNTVVCGFAYRQSGAVSMGASGMVSFASFEGTYGSIGRAADGSIGWSRTIAGTTTTESSAPGVLHMDVWYYIEWKCVLDVTSGSSIVRVNNVEQINFTGRTISDWPTGPGYAPISLPPRVFHVQGNTNNRYFLDDLYVLDGSGPAPWNDFLGDCRVEYLKPRAAGAAQEWPTLAGASSHWLAVNDNAIPDEDGSYVEANAANLTDTYLYDLTGLPTGQPVFGAQLSLYAEKTEVGPRVIAPVMNSIVGPPTYGPSYQSYQYYTVPYATNPATGLAWTVATINAIDAGVKVIT